MPWPLSCTCPVSEYAQLVRHVGLALLLITAQSTTALPIQGQVWNVASTSEAFLYCFFLGPSTPGQLSSPALWFHGVLFVSLEQHFPCSLVMVYGVCASVMRLWVLSRQELHLTHLCTQHLVHVGRQYLSYFKFSRASSSREETGRDRVNGTRNKIGSAQKPHLMGNSLPCFSDLPHLPSSDCFSEEDTLESCVLSFHLALRQHEGWELPVSRSLDCRWSGRQLRALESVQFMEAAAALVRLCSGWRGWDWKGEERHWRYSKALYSSLTNEELL